MLALFKSGIISFGSFVTFFRFAMTRKVVTSFDPFVCERVMNRRFYPTHLTHLTSCVCACVCVSAVVGSVSTDGGAPVDDAAGRRRRGVDDGEPIVVRHGTTRDDWTKSVLDDDGDDDDDSVLAKSASEQQHCVDVRGSWRRVG